jgi:hypothetical protein
VINSAGNACELPDLNRNRIADENLVFVTSRDVQGNLGGASGADAICNELAAAANLDRTFSAWLSSDGQLREAARDRIGLGPYYRLDMTIVATNITTLTDTSLDNPISLTEWAEGRDVVVRTGTTADGRPPAGVSATCVGWSTNSPDLSAVSGRSTLFDAGWTANSASGGASCQEPAAIYCVQDDCPGDPHVDFLRDFANCGGCGIACQRGTTCTQGRCVSGQQVQDPVLP